MIRYVTYHESTGAIVETGLAHPDELGCDTPEGHKTVAGHASCHEHFVDVATGAILKKTVHPCMPHRTCGKVGQEWKMAHVIPGSRVAVRAPGGAIVASLTPDGGDVVRYTPAEPGKHLIEVYHPGTHPHTWHLDVLP